ncbi:hypothetical protein KCU62_g8648, partial [Aureobasidium sp. EXF-3399]
MIDTVQFGRSAQYPADCGRMCLMCSLVYMDANKLWALRRHPTPAKASSTPTFLLQPRVLPRSTLFVWSTGPEDLSEHLGGNPGMPSPRLVLASTYALIPRRRRLCSSPKQNYTRPHHQDLHKDSTIVHGYSNILYGVDLHFNCCTTRSLYNIELLNHSLNYDYGDIPGNYNHNDDNYTHRHEYSSRITGATCTNVQQNAGSFYYEPSGQGTGDSYIVSNSNCGYLTDGGVGG